MVKARKFHRAETNEPAEVRKRKRTKPVGTPGWMGLPGQDLRGGRHKLPSLSGATPQVCGIGRWDNLSTNYLSSGHIQRRTNIYTLWNNRMKVEFTNGLVFGLHGHPSRVIFHPRAKPRGLQGVQQRRPWP